MYYHLHQRQHECLFAAQRLNISVEKPPSRVCGTSASPALLGYTAYAGDSKPEMDALLRQPDRHAVLGMRDYVLLLLLYNSGARADELARLTIGQLQLDDPPSVRIHGKGNKIRMCPLWPMMVPMLEKMVDGRGPDQVVFLGRANKPMTRFGVHRLVTQYAEMASDEIPSMQSKRVSPHTIRHTTAVHLLRSGVDINTIRTWLGHVSLGTTNIYAEVDLEMKAKALASVDVSGQSMEPLRQCALPSLMTLLRGI